jgi:hypothetical protein
MKTCDLQTGIQRLQKETKRLREKWEATKDFWKDQAACDFEQKYLQPLDPTLRLTLAAVYELAEIIAEAEKRLSE